MKRRAFLSGVAATAVSGTAIPALAAPKKFRWRMVLAVPRTLPIWGPGMERFASHVEKLSGDRLKIRVYGAGELVPALGTFDAVSSGEVQLGSAASYYWLGKVPAAPFFTAVPFGLDSMGTLAWIQDGGGQQLWDELMAPSGVICMPCGSTGPQATGWFNKKIDKPEDLKGLKIRIPGLAANIYSRLGAKPILIAGGDLFTSLATGVIDAAEWVGPYHDYTLGLHKAASYFYASSWQEPGAVLELMINKKAWDELPEDLQLMVRTVARETSLWMHNLWEAKNAEFLEKLVADSKITVLELPDEILKAFHKEATVLMNEVASGSPIASKIHSSYTEFQKRYHKFQLTTGTGYISSLRW